MSNKAAASEGTKALAAAGVVIDDSAVGAGIQTVSESDLGQVAAQEAFMNEPVTIRVHQSINPNDAPYVVLTPNSAAERVVAHRGVPTEVKRKHVEILARMKEIRYAQKQATSVDLESGNYLYASVGQVYPFEVIKDQNPKGRAWLDNILAEPV